MKHKIRHWQEWRKYNYIFEKVVQLVFVGICGAIGLAGDVLFHLCYLAEPFEQVVKDFVFFKQLTYGAYAMLAFGCLLLWVLYLLQKRIMTYGMPVSMTIKENADSVFEQNILKMVGDVAQAIKLPQVPEIVIVDSPILNAFVSGSNDRKAILVLSMGLFDALSLEQLQAVITQQLCLIKLNMHRLTLAVALTGNVLLMGFDLIFHPYLWGAKQRKDPNPFAELIIKGLKVARFLIPVGSFYFRFLISPTRILDVNAFTADVMKNKQVLASALLKIYNQQLNNDSKFGPLYAKMAFDEIRRESYLFDPADINPAQTFASPFTVQPSLKEQLNVLGFKDAEDVADNANRTD